MRTQALFLFAALCASSLWSEDYYVSGSGNDRNNGQSTGSPFRTLQKAAGLVNAGDTVWVMNGIYTNNHPEGNVVTLSRSGTATAPITWKAYVGHSPELVFNGWHGILVTTARYQVIDGLTITGNKDNVTLAAATADGVGAGSGSPRFNGNGLTVDGRNLSNKPHHITMRNLTIRKACGAGIGVINADYITIENCRIYETSWYSRWATSGISLYQSWNSTTATTTGYRNIIRNNICWNNRSLVKWQAKNIFSDGNGIIFDDSKNGQHNSTLGAYRGRTLIANNVCVNNGGSGIHSYQSEHVDIVNNTAYQNGQTVGYADIFATSSNDVIIRNNIMYARNGGDANTNYGNTGSVIYDYNVYFNGRVNKRGANDRVGDPLFVAPSLNAATANFRLRAGSPAIDSATVLLPIDSDIVGTNRPQGAGRDRGAYEFITGNITAPVITSTLTANGTVGVALSYQITARNNPTSYNATNLPAGLNINTGSGVISGTPTSAGSRTVSISASNSGGTGSATLVITIATPADTTAPATPGAPATTSTTSPTPTLSGTTEASVTVRIYRDNTLVRTQTANGSGAWSWTVTPALGVGSHSFTISATDAAGNTSGRSPARVITVADTTAPATPAAPATTSTTSATPTLSGTTEANATVRIYRNNALVRTQSANASGTWTWIVAPDLAAGSHSFIVSATDAAGNTSARSPARIITVPDTTAPESPDAPDASSTTSVTPILSGTTERSATVRIYRNNTLVATVTANTSGTWSWGVTPALATGVDLAFSITASDAAGNTSARSDSVVIRPTPPADTTPPAKPAAPLIANPTSATPTLTGVIEAGATARIFRDNVWQQGVASHATTGAWSWTSPPLPAGSYDFTLSAQDAAGNISTRSDATTVTVAVTIDTTAPVTPAAPLADEDDTATPTLSGTTEPNATVTILVDGIPIRSTTAGPDGQWSWTIDPPLTPGPHAITVTSTDTSDNESAPSDEITVTVPASPAGGDNASAGDGGGTSCGLGGGMAAFAAMMLMMLMRLRLRR